ncbi:hypothetical protein ACQ7HM_17565 [Williamsia sp. MIQD14]|uniref:hypothetical protein n=1 Tax=Williamsia sp. MIQD14 TaxID=3425703 RepID=UPI003DA05185
MTDESWRPLGVDDENQIAAYDALHDGLPGWMQAAFWAWIRVCITQHRRYPGNRGSEANLNEDLMEEMCQVLQISMPNLRSTGVAGGGRYLDSAIGVLRRKGDPLQVADYLLAHSASSTRAEEIEALLERSKSAWRVGTRAGKPGLVRRVPLGVQAGADSVMARAAKAGVRLASAWEALYSPAPNVSEAYRLAILAVEDAAIPVVSPTNKSATLGTVLSQMENQGDWSLQMTREHPKAPPREVVIGMMRMLWHGQHDRHGGQPSAPGNVSDDEAKVAVGLATTLVDWFSAGLVSRLTP